METIGILGGTFDPIHNGHLAIAQDVQWELGLRRILFIPAAQQPLKPRGHCAKAQERLEMTRLAVAGNAAFDVCDIEAHRQGPSYTVDTLNELRALNPDTRYVFVIGADTIQNLPRWHRMAELARLCSFAIVKRPGWNVALGELAVVGVPIEYVVMEGPALDISATSLRDRARRGAPLRYQVPDAVERYIREHRLYQLC